MESANSVLASNSLPMRFFKSLLLSGGFLSKFTKVFKYEIFQQRRSEVGTGGIKWCEVELSG